MSEVKPNNRVYLKKFHTKFKSHTGEINFNLMTFLTH